MYPETMVAPLREELTDVGFIETRTPEEVRKNIEAEGTTLVFVNSVCGCAARSARPAVIASLMSEKKPDRITTVFAGADIEATATAREYMIPFPPSSPSIALFKDGELVHMLERHHIEGRPAEMIAANLINAYHEYC